jgi:hexokinase
MGSPLDLDALALGAVRWDRMVRDFRALLARALEARLSLVQFDPSPASSSPPGPRQDRALALDLGGTWARSALVRVTAQGATIAAGPLAARMPWQRGRPLDQDRFFEFQSEMIQKLAPEPDLPLGYCFSFPARPTRDGDARLLGWTKGVEVPGMVGRRVGRGMIDWLARRGGIRCPKVRVINDSQALVYAAPFQAPTPLRMGLVVGTGTNLAVAWPPPRQERPPRGGPVPETVINLEAGGFFLPHLTRWDVQVDGASENPGEQRLEKAVSGLYLDRLLARIWAAAGRGAPPGLAALSGAAPEEQDAGMLALAGALVRRSARIVAALMAAAIDLRRQVSPIDAVQVVAEGGLFWSRWGQIPLYAQTVSQTLTQWLAGQGLAHVRVTIQALADATLLGAARAALEDASRG